MMLSAELFEWMIGTIESARRPRLDLRRNDRVTLRGSIEVFLLRSDGDEVDGPYAAGVLDASANGMRLEIPARVHVHEQVLLRLPRMGEESLMLLSQVVHCRQNENMSNVGIKFLSAVGDHDAVAEAVDAPRPACRF